jgi:hypothetical protein
MPAAIATEWRERDYGKRTTRACDEYCSHWRIRLRHNLKQMERRVCTICHGLSLRETYGIAPEVRMNPNNIGGIMQKRCIWSSLLVLLVILGADAIAAGNEGVVILSCGLVTSSGGGCPPACAPPVDGINVASFSANSHVLPPSLAIGSSCAAALGDLLGIGFQIVNILPVGAGVGISSAAFTQPQITYTLVKGRSKD